VLAVLPVLMAVLALYHPILLVFPEHIEVALLIETAGFALLVLFVGLTLQMHRRMSHGVGSVVAIADIAVLDFVLGSVAALGLLYLLYAESLVVHYERFFRLITVGMLVYALTGPVIGTIAPAYVHLIHATAALFITVGLWDLVRGTYTTKRTSRPSSRRVSTGGTATLST